MKSSMPPPLQLLASLVTSLPGIIFEEKLYHAKKPTADNKLQDPKEMRKLANDFGKGDSTAHTESTGKASQQC